MKNILLITLLSTLFLCTSSFAERVKYRGPGQPNNGPFYLTTSTNGTTASSNYTFGDSKNKKQVSLNRFVADNLNNLSIDIAKGSGEYVEALAEIKQVSRDKKKLFFSSLKTNFDIIFPSAEVESLQVVAEIIKIERKI
ncbi:MAG: DUF3015 domain-containing protein [Desulfobacterales bacterium]|nr:DUF3015 domain-containing protein [Desulfobacterales bacterium]